MLSSFEDVTYDKSSLSTPAVKVGVDELDGALQGLAALKLI